MAESFNQDQQAIQYLRRINDDYPEQPVAVEANSYLDILLASSDNDEDDGDALVIDENQ